ncbi:MAG: magnesium transporter CorA family protein, partial [Terriglobales bacterium]
MESDSISALQQPLGKVAWFDLSEPASPALEELAHRYALHELQIEDVRHGGQRAKTEEHPGYLFSVLKTLQSGEELAFGDLYVFFGREFLLTIHAGPSGVVEKVRRRAEGDQVVRLDRLVYLLVDTLVDEYIPVLDQVADEISDIESEVLHRPDPPMLRQIFRLKRKLIEFRRTAGAMREVVNALMRREHGLLGDDLDPYFRDVYDHLVRIVDLVETYRDLLTGSLDIYLSAVANRTNQVMKVLTIYGTIALPFLIITGFFGMNLHLPWSQDPRGATYAT